MNERNEKQIALFSDETLQELEQKMSQAQDQLSHHLHETERCRQLIVHIKGVLGEGRNNKSQTGPSAKELFGNSQSASSLNPTEFVLKLLNESPDRWVPVQEILFKSRAAYEAGEVTNRGAEIGNSVHGVLTRFRKNHQVWTRGKKATRKYKLKP